MDLGRPNAEIGRKMANGQLLFLALMGPLFYTETFATQYYIILLDRCLGTSLNIYELDFLLILYIAERCTSSNA